MFNFACTVTVTSFGTCMNYEIFVLVPRNNKKVPIKLRDFFVDPNKITTVQVEYKNNSEGLLLFST